MAQGATFNADSSSETKGWDDPKSPYLYYGGAAVILKDGHLEFTAKVLTQQAKQLSIGSLSTQTLGSLKIQVKSQLNPQNQRHQLNLKNRNWQKYQLLKKKNQFHRQNQNIKLYLSYQANQLNQKHLSCWRILLRKKQKKPVVEWHKNVVLIKKDEKPQPKPEQNQSLSQGQNQNLSKKIQNQYYQILVQLNNHSWPIQPLLA